MGRRILAFFLGFIFAFVAIAGAVCIVVFAIKIDQMVPQTDTYLGDLAKMSIYDVGQSLTKLYADKKIWTDENGKYYSLGHFCENYNINLSTALGMEIPSEVLDIPAFEFFNEGGMNNAMKQIKVSTLPAIVNMFGGKNEDGTSNGMFGDNVMSELSKFSMYDLLSNEEVGVAGVFANVKFVDLLPDSFPAEDSDNKLMWAVGQSKIGGVLNGIGGESSILLQLKAGGAFETVGELELTSLLGESQYMNAILGSNAKFADFIDDEGNVRLDDIINGVSIGELLGCQRKDITELTDYVTIAGQSPNADKQVKQKTEGDNVVYAMSANNEDWYEAYIDCDLEEDHTHSEDCFKFIWYATEACSSQHNHAASDDMLKEGVYYPRVNGLYAILAAISIADLTSGNDEALMKEIKNIKIGDVLDTTEVNDTMRVFLDFTIQQLMDGAIDDMYLGEFFKFTRHGIQDLDAYDKENIVTIYKERDYTVLAYYIMQDDNGNIAMSYDLKDWYEGSFNCDETDPGHVHNDNCYLYNWYHKDGDNAGEQADGVQNKLAGKQIADLKFLNEEVQRLTLEDVFGKNNVPSVLKAIGHVKIGDLNSSINTICLGDLLEYTREQTCENEDPDHVHEYDCYIWYNKRGEVVTGMMAKLAIKQVGEMDDLVSTIRTFTLRDVLGDDGVPDVLKSIADSEIKDLNQAIKEMRLGDFLEYEQRLICENEEEDHEHTDDCYAWYKKDGELAVGMMAKLASKTVDELSNLDEIVQDFTLRDVLGERIPTMLLDVADTKVSELDSAIQGIYLGSALGYSRKVVDKSEYTIKIFNDVYRRMSPEAYVKREPNTDTWYEAVLTCSSKEHDVNDSHTAACYGYVWYDGEELVSGIVKAFVNSKVSEVNSKMQTVTLGEMGIGGNTILDALQDTAIVDIGKDINNLKMAVVLGYEKRYTCGLTEGMSHTHSDACDYVWLAPCSIDHATTSTDHEESEHLSGSDPTKNYYTVKGLNAKIAEKTVEEMTGDSLTEIALNLSIGDLIDSGMISLGATPDERDNNAYKLALIFASGDKHNVNGTGSGCTYANYLFYSTQVEVGISTKAYWDKCHASYTMSAEEYEEHTNGWKNLTLKQFVSALLQVL